MIVDATLQDVIATLVALAAGGSIVWRLVGLVRPHRQRKPGCSSCAGCPSSSSDGATPGPIGHQPIV